MNSDSNNNEDGGRADPVGWYELDNVDREIIKHLVRFPALTLVELGKLCGVTDRVVRYRKKKPAFKKALQELTGTTDFHLKEGAREAAMAVRKLLQEKDPSVRLGAAKILLGPYVNQPQVLVNNQPTLKIYETTITPDGNLLQSVIEGELDGGTIESVDVDRVASLANGLIAGDDAPQTISEEDS